MNNRHRLITILLLVFFVVSSWSAQSCTSVGLKESGEEASEQTPAVGTKSIGLVYQIQTLCNAALDKDKVSADFTNELRKRMALQGYTLLPVTSEEEAIEKGLDRLLHIQYSETWAGSYKLANGILWPSWHMNVWSNLEASSNGTRIYCTVQGWDSVSGWGPLFALSATSSDKVKSVSKDKERDLRQSAIENFWLDFPEALGSLVFLDSTAVANDKWILQPDVTEGLTAEDCLIVDNLLALQTSGMDGNYIDSCRLNLINLATGSMVREFRAARVTSADGVIFIYSEGRIYCIDSLSGSTLWEFAGTPVALSTRNECLESKNQILETSLQTSGDEVYVAYEKPNSGYRFVRLDKTTGKQKWETTWQAKVFIRQISSGIVLVDDAETLYALDSENGNIKWDLAKTSYTLVMYGQTVLVVNSASGGSCGLDIRTGHEIWCKESGLRYDQVDIDGDTACCSSTVITYYPGRDLSGTWRERLYTYTQYYLTRYDMKTGDKLWSKSWDTYKQPTERIIDWGKKYGMWWEKSVRSVYCVDFQSGSIIWQRTVEGDIYSYAIEPEQNVIVVSFNNGGRYKGLRAFDMKDGTELWTFIRGTCEQDGKNFDVYPRSFWCIVDGQVLCKVEVPLGSRAGPLYDCNLYSLDARSGNVTWMVPIKELSWFEASVDNNIIVAEITYLCDGCDITGGFRWFTNIRALDSKSGKMKWNSGLGILSGVLNEPYKPSLVNSIVRDELGEVTIDTDRYRLLRYLNDNTLYLWAFDSITGSGNNTHYLLAIDVSTGELKWHFRADEVIIDPPFWNNTGSTFFWTRRALDEHGGVIYSLHCIASGSSQ